MSRRSRFVTAFAGALALGCGLTAAGPTVDRIESINIVPARLSLVPFQSVDLAVFATTSRGNQAETSMLQWTTTGGTVTSNGIINGVLHVTYSSPSPTGIGNHFFTVTSVTGAPSGIADILVTASPAPVTSVTVTPANVTLTVGDTTRYYATLTEATGRVVVGRLIDWSTTDGAVATVLATGSVRAMGVGTATITATSEGHSGTAVVTVTP
jgi:uncharacterized protein YjdB